MRAAEAAARGEPYPPPKKTRTPRSSIEGAAPVVNMFTPVAAGPSGLGESSAGKKPARPKKTKQATVRNMSLEATAHAAEQMHTELGGASGSTAPETQVSVQAGPENLIVELQEHAALAEHARPVDPEVMDTGESGGISEQRLEQQQGQQREHQPEHQTAPEYRIYETHRRTPTA